MVQIFAPLAVILTPKLWASSQFSDSSNHYDRYLRTLFVTTLDLLVDLAHPWLLKFKPAELKNSVLNSFLPLFTWIAVLCPDEEFDTDEGEEDCDEDSEESLGESVQEPLGDIGAGE